MAANSRRAWLTTAALASVAATVATVPAAVLAAEPDPHAAWLAEWLACDAWLNSPATAGFDELNQLPEWHRCLELEDLISRTPARTLAGAATQLRLVQHYASFASDRDEAAVANALTTVERLAGEGRHA